VIRRAYELGIAVLMLWGLIAAADSIVTAIDAILGD
jgi:hypothetical protein